MYVRLLFTFVRSVYTYAFYSPSYVLQLSGCEHVGRLLCRVRGCAHRWRRRGAPSIHLPRYHVRLLFTFLRSTNAFYSPSYLPRVPSIHLRTYYIYQSKCPTPPRSRPRLRASSATSAFNSPVCVPFIRTPSIHLRTCHMYVGIPFTFIRTVCAYAFYSPSCVPYVRTPSIHLRTYSS